MSKPSPRIAAATPSVSAHLGPDHLRAEVEVQARIPLVRLEVVDQQHERPVQERPLEDRRRVVGHEHVGQRQPVVHVARRDPRRRRSRPSAASSGRGWVRLEDQRVVGGSARPERTAVERRRARAWRAPAAERRRVQDDPPARERRVGREQPRPRRRRAPPCRRSGPCAACRGRAPARAASAAPATTARATPRRTRPRSRSSGGGTSARARSSAAGRVDAEPLERARRRARPGRRSSPAGAARRGPAGRRCRR